MFLIVGMMMIVAACGDESDGNNTLTITKDCTSTECILITKHIPKHISRIKLLNVEAIYSLKESMFETNIIPNITYLELSNDKLLLFPLRSIRTKAFRRLQNLEELHIHVDSLITISKDAFHGLNVLKTLNLNGCKNLKPGSLEQALKPPALTSLENLFISGISRLIWHEILSNRTLRKLDVSKSTMIVHKNYYCENCADLEYLNASAASFVPSKYDVNDFTVFRSRSGDRPFFTALTNLEILDMSYMDFQFFLYIENKHLKVLNISGFCKYNGTFDMYDQRVVFNQSDYMYDQSFYTYEDSNLCFLLLSCNYSEAIELLCNRQNVEVLELALNHLEYIDPIALADFENSLTINLSGNKLFMMMKDHPDQFEILFRSLNHLENINLSSNKLSDIPAYLFESNTKLRKIDLSSNKLQKINLHVTHLDHLDVLDLENNAIIVLDSASISVIDKFLNGSFVNLISNPLDCSHCADLDFVSWLAKSDKLQREGLTCLGSKTVLFVDDALVAVQMICDEEIKLRLLISIPVALLALVNIIIFIFYCIRRQSQKRCRQREIREIKKIIRKREMFAVFLTYCSEDDDFIKQYVVDNFNQNLKLVIGTDRDLVCEGDRYFRLGKPIMDEISELLDRSGVLVAVLSNNYCQSVFCRNEFQQAIYKEIPILLMLKETVDPDNMSPSMRDMFEKKTRVLWEYENGEYKLKTTWRNVCQSVVEMIDIKKLRLLTKTILEEKKIEI